MKKVLYPTIIFSSIVLPTVSPSSSLPILPTPSPPDRLGFVWTENLSIPFSSSYTFSTIEDIWDSNNTLLPNTSNMLDFFSFVGGSDQTIHESMFISAVQDVTGIQLIHSINLDPFDNKSGLTYTSISLNTESSCPQIYFEGIDISLFSFSHNAEFDPGITSLDFTLIFLTLE